MHAIRHAWRVYVTWSLPLIANEQSIILFCNQIMVVVRTNIVGRGILGIQGIMFTIGVSITCILLIFVEFEYKLLDHSNHGNL